MCCQTGCIKRSGVDCFDGLHKTHWVAKFSILLQLCRSEHCLKYGNLDPFHMYLFWALRRQWNKGNQVFVPTDLQQHQEPGLDCIPRLRRRRREDGPLRLERPPVGRLRRHKNDPAKVGVRPGQRIRRGNDLGLDLDDFANRCGCEHYPLLRAINRVLRNYSLPDPVCDIKSTPAAAAASVKKVISPYFSPNPAYGAPWVASSSQYAPFTSVYYPNARPQVYYYGR